MILLRAHIIRCEIIHLQFSVMAPPVQWNRIPPCLAHTILKEMFENKKIQSDYPSAKIYDMNDEFYTKFYTNMFRNVFQRAASKL